MPSILGCIKASLGLLYRFLSALPIKPLTLSNYSTSTSLTTHVLIYSIPYMYLENLN